MAPLDIAVLGGGVSVAALADLVAGEPSLAQSTLRLHARRAGRLRSIADHCHRSVGGDIDVMVADSLVGAVSGADVVVDLIRIGGLDARGEDEALRWRGAPGDEGLGPGGVANARRTLGPTKELVDSIRRHAPDAIVLNMAAPLGVTTRAFLDAGLCTVGLCELPLVVAGRLAEAGAPDVRYVGSNHLGLHLPCSADPGDLGRLAAVARETGLAGKDTVRRLGGVPAPYFHRVVRPDLGRPLGIGSTEGRADELGSLGDDVLCAMERGDPVRARELLARRPTPWFSLSLVPTLVAVASRTPARLACNVANHGHGRAEPWVDWLPGDMVIELVGEWGPDGFSPEIPDEPRAPSVDYLRSVADADAATWRAADLGSAAARTAAVRAWDGVDARGWAARHDEASVPSAPTARGRGAGT